MPPPLSLSASCCRLRTPRPHQPPPLRLISLADRPTDRPTHTHTHTHTKRFLDCLRYRFIDATNFGWAAPASPARALDLFCRWKNNDPARPQPRPRIAFNQLDMLARRKRVHYAIKKGYSSGFPLSWTKPIPHLLFFPVVFGSTQHRIEPMVFPRFC